MLNNGSMIDMLSNRLMIYMLSNGSMIDMLGNRTLIDMLNNGSMIDICCRSSLVLIFAASLLSHFKLSANHWSPS